MKNCQIKKDAYGKITEYIEIGKSGVMENFYNLLNRTLTKSNKTKMGVKKSKIIFDEDCELSIMNIEPERRVTAIKLGGTNLTPPKTKSRIDLNEKTGLLSYTIKADLFQVWATKLNF